jgi:hypothetical protein
MGSNQMAAQKQRAAEQAMVAQLANQDEYRRQSLEEIMGMQETFEDLPGAQQDVSEELFAKSRPTDIGEESAQSRLADLKATKASRASADVRGRALAARKGATERSEMAVPLSTLLGDARRDWAMTPARMQSAMNKVSTPGLMTIGNLLSTAGKLGSMGYGMYSGGMFGSDPTQLASQAQGLGMSPMTPSWQGFTGRYGL